MLGVVTRQHRHVSRVTCPPAGRQSATEETPGRHTSDGTGPNTPTLGTAPPRCPQLGRCCQLPRAPTPTSSDIARHRQTSLACLAAAASAAQIEISNEKRKPSVKRNMGSVYWGGYECYLNLHQFPMTLWLKSSLQNSTKVSIENLAYFDLK